MNKRLIITAIALLSLPCIAEAPNYHISTDSLIEALQAHPGMPLAVAVGKGYKMAPIRLDVKCLTKDQRRNWWDNHSEAGCELVVVLSETTSVEAQE